MMGKRNSFAWMIDASTIVIAMIGIVIPGKQVVEINCYTMNIGTDWLTR